MRWSSSPNRSARRKTTPSSCWGFANNSAKQAAARAAAERKLRFRDVSLRRLQSGRAALPIAAIDRLPNLYATGDLLDGVRRPLIWTGSRAVEHPPATPLQPADRRIFGAGCRYDLWTF